MCRTESDRRHFTLELFDERAEAILLRLGHIQKLDADAMGSTPPDCSIVDCDGIRFAWYVQEKCDLHPCEGVDEALYSAAFC